MISKKISIYLIFIILFSVFSSVHAHKKYEDNNGGKTNFSHKTDSEWDKGYCYTFSIDNLAKKTIYNWQLSFELEDGIHLTSKRGFDYKKVGKKYFLTGLSRNQNLQIGQKGIQLGFCTDGKQKPKNVKWEDEDDETYYEESFDCSKMPNQNSCESGTAKTTCTWENNSCKKLNPPTQENSNSGTLVCEITSGSGKILEPNLVKNYSFEKLQENNIVKKWWNKIVGGKKSYKGQVKDLADWTEKNNSFKIWNNDQNIPAQHENIFVEIDANNTISQQIQTKKDTKYKLGFYSLGGDELTVKWNSTPIHQEQNNYASGYLGWVKHEYIVNGTDGISNLSFTNSKQDYSNYKKPISYNDSSCKGKAQNECNGMCTWEDDLCIEKPQAEDDYVCGRNNYGNILNLNAKEIILRHKKNKIFCNQWNNYGTKIYSGDEDDYFRFKYGNGLFVNMGGGINTFFHTIYSSQMENSDIEGTADGYNKFIISDENDDYFTISGDCSKNCTISLHNNIWTLWRGWRFQNIRLKNIHKIEFKNKTITYGHGGVNIENCEKKEEIKTTYELDLNKIDELGYILEDGKYYKLQNITQSVSGGNYNVIYGSFSDNKSYYLAAQEEKVKKIKLGFDKFYNHKNADQNGVLKIDFLDENNEVIYSVNQVPFNNNGLNYVEYDIPDYFAKIKFTTNGYANLDLEKYQILAKDKVTTLKTHITDEQLPKIEKQETILVPDLTKCSLDRDENEKESQIRIGIDHVTLHEIEDNGSTQKIDLFSLINDSLKNEVQNGSCSDIFYGLEDSIKKELINKMLSSGDYTHIAQDFLNTVTTNSKETIVKNITYELIKEQLTPCHTDEEKNAFYRALYEQTIDKINTCVLNNLNSQVKKQVDAISYLKTNMESCTQNGNTLTLNFFNSYGIHSQ